MSYLPSNLHAPTPRESKEERFNRRMAVADLLRRRRRLAGLSFGKVAVASMKDIPSIWRYEQGEQPLSDAMAERILAAIARLESTGVGNPKKAAEARAYYEALDADTSGSPS